MWTSPTLGLWPAASVVGKEYREAGTSYTTQVIGGQTRQVPHATAEAFVLDLDVDGDQAQAAVDRSLYEAVKSGDRVQIEFTRRRISGMIVVGRVTH